MGTNSDRDAVPATIAVTGASGFVGGWVVRELEALAQTRPLNLVRLLDQSNGSRTDIREAQGVYEEVASTAPEAVIHLAAIAAPLEAHSDPVAAWQVNVMGTLTLARAIMALAPSARFIFVGSSEAYGASFNRTDGPIEEDAPFDPINDYGATKAAADIMVGQLARRGLNAVRFRPFNHTGPGQAANYVASDFARQIARIEAGLQEPIMRVGNLSAQRDFIDVRDIVDAYVTAALGHSGLEAGTALNLSSGNPVSIQQLLDTLIAASTTPISVRVDPDRLRPNETPYASGNPARAEKLLGWRPKRDLTDSLHLLLDDWRAKVAGRQIECG